MSREPSPDIHAFASIELFRGVPERTLLRIARAARVRRLPRRSRIFSQGDDDVRAHAVIEGAVSIVQSGSDGTQVVMRIAGPGQTFGTVPIFGDRRHWSDAVTMCDTLEASWNETDFLALLGADASVAINLIRIVCARLQEMEDRVRELATRRAERRIACTVLRLARQNGRTTPAGIAIDVPLRRKDVADIAGTTLHTASRVLAAWQKAGLLANQSRTLIVKGLPELRAMAEE